MNCPNCKAAAAEGAKDCPACGIVFEKWARRQAEKDLEAYARRESGLPEPGAAGAAPAGPAAPPAAPSRALRALKWAGGALLLWLILPASLLRVVGLAPKTKALSFTATDLSGQKMRLSDCAGRPVLLYVWTTDSPRAQENLTMMAGLYATYKDTHVCYMSVTIDENFEGVVRPFAAAQGIPYPVYNGYGFVTRMFWPDLIPTVWLIDRKGYVRDHFSPSRDDAAKISAGMRPLIFDGSDESLVPAGSAPPSDLAGGPEGEAAVASNALKLLEAGAFDELERTAAGYRNDQERLSDGRWKLDLFYAGVSGFGPGTSLGVPEDRWIARQDLLDKWRTAKPQSVTARVATAMETVGYAWHARGGDVARNVSDEAMSTFKTRLGAAADMLDGAEKLSEKCPVLKAERLTILQGLGTDRKAFDAVYEAAISSVPAYYGYYEAKAAYLDPRWHGEPGEWEAYAAEAAESTKAREGMSLYARIVLHKMNQHGRFGQELFSETAVDWPSLRQGLLDADQRYPSTWNKNLLAWFACLAGDKKTAKAAFERIGDSYNPALWRNAINYGSRKRWAKSETLLERAGRLFGRG